MTIITHKGYTPLSEAITRIGRSLSDEWTGEEFSPAVASMAKINRDTQTYLIGWVRERCADIKDCNVTWEEATENYIEARSLLDEIAQQESIKDGEGHLTKIWNDPKREVVWEWPAGFSLSKDDLETLKAEEEGFRAPREAAFERLDKAVRLLQQELCGTPPDCKDAIPALWGYPDKMPDRIDATSWVGSAGLDRLKRAARDDYSTPDSSRIIISSEHIERLCAPPEPPDKKSPKGAGGRPPKWDWDGAIAHIIAIANSPDGLPSQQADIEQLVTEWFAANYDDEPAESTIRERVHRYCDGVLKEAGN